MARGRVVLSTGLAAGLLAVLLLAGCGGTTAEPAGRGAGPYPAPTSSARPHAPATATPPGTATAPTVPPSRAPRSKQSWRDPRWHFYSGDRRLHGSAWFAGRHRVMIPFGCTAAPYYRPDPRCSGDRGFHHGIDVAMRCGTPLRTGRAATVLDPASLGAAYGAQPVLLRIGDQDVVIGHTSRVFVAPGEGLAAGERFALAGDSGAPDGCHLHFEVRPAGGGYTTAVDPSGLLGLS
ncbi:MAG TPA: peptidoglycan DD-metalloendopeptidase family protein [Nocardioides sp.]|nr:peptidoglycan DD-metalloendopeptidase family protein [Nocardioides sp.]